MQIQPGLEACSLLPPPLQPSHALTSAFSSRTGVLLLSQVVTKMDTSVLDRQMSKLLMPAWKKYRLQTGSLTLTRLVFSAAKTLTTFFVDKLSEKASLVPCATALTELVKSPTFGTGEGIEVAKG